MNRLPLTYHIYNSEGETIEKIKITARFCSSEKVPVIEINLPSEYGDRILKDITITKKQFLKFAKLLTPTTKGKER